MSTARKRPRDIDEASRAECPFSIRVVDSKEKEQKKKKRRRTDGDEADEADKKIPMQMSPFAPSGKFRTYETMDIHYAVEPAKKWSEMTRYNSFVLNGAKYFSDNYIYVANESTIERQKAITNKESLGPRQKSDDDWVARILEIRASDEHHVYARVYWMYWPDELPSNTLDGRKTVMGRQAYHGANELIASNHMDIINVVSVTQQATVNQWYEENDEDVQSALYWRQAIDVRTFELSTVELICKCAQPGNPDKVLIGCSNEDCGKWLHEECLKHDVLTKTFERLGTDTPHKTATTELVKDEKEEEESKRPLSPVETAGAIELPIQVKTDGEGEANGSVQANDNVDVKRLDDDEDEDAPVAKEESVQPQQVNGNGTTATDTPGKGTAGRKPGRPRKKGTDEAGPTDMKSKPYEGLFEATVRMDLSPPMIEIKDLREGIEGGDKTWQEDINCLVCDSRIN